ncbi:ribose 5-phosphate isomerase B [Planomicrobium sp. CPCC 101110]|uniref:ribose 5-phosphate isomerase B n=1 Tax=Planomicrobium sp. CPCC 101110 TaxID=2599619 RepID=UPI0011B523F7|nr:ribose 5-phosphate isomerase B [Planomicrobium sp. CPCC 101110]TWT25413.1 ribose 5-phosphate isomerase B [Planomicrobium sp. CPCC 101110]
MIAIGCDHSGVMLKNTIIRHLEEQNIKVLDYGTYTTEMCDFPGISQKVTDSIINGESEQGILICGTGIGMSIAANRVKGIRAALCSDTFTAEMTKKHNDANVLVLGARVIGESLAIKILDTFLESSFANEARNIRRLKLLEEMTSN